MQRGFLGTKEGLGDGERRPEQSEKDEEDELPDRDSMDEDDKLCYIFVKYDKDGDGLLCYEEASSLILPSPEHKAAKSP